jgi:hypothetical protein
VDQLEKKFKKQFTQLKAQFEADDKISELEDDQSHFQFTQHFCLLTTMCHLSSAMRRWRLNNQKEN